MKIAMLVDRYKPYVSGITNYISINKEFLEKSGHEVFVITFGDEDYLDDESNIIRSHGLPLIDTGYYVNLQYNQRARHLLYSMDIAHVHHPFLSGSLALRYCRPRGIPIVFTNHTRYDLYAQVYLPMLPDVISETAIRAYLPVFCRACDLVVSPSPGMAEVLQHFGVDTQIAVIPNGVNLDRFKVLVQPVNLGRFGIDKKDIVLIYVGRLGPEKNLPFLLRSFAGTTLAYENIHLLLVGDGPERDNLQSQATHMNIADKVHFTGLIPYEELPGYLASANAFITASVTEVHPLSVIEAMAAGLPVLGIHSPGISDSVIDNVSGFLSPEDLAIFTAKMVKLATEPQLRKVMGEASRQAAEKYHIERTTQMMLAHYTRLAAQSGSKKSGLRSRITRIFDRWS